MAIIACVVIIIVEMKDVLCIVLGLSPDRTKETAQSSPSFHRSCTAPQGIEV